MATQGDDRNGSRRAHGRREELLDQLTARLNEFVEADGARTDPSEAAYDRLASAIVTAELYFRQYADPDGGEDDDEGGESIESRLSELKARAGRIRELQTQQVQVRRPAPGRSSAHVAESEPALYQVNTEWLKETAVLVFKIEREAGFGADLKEQTQRTEIDGELIEKVEKWRKQNLEN
ncbi:hypothetical protein DVK02_14935 [Halobellus sp. Atlit-31R]|nr:hypothetical protein DVK02_14935 [Halobellus sp. Atlit-31R]